MTNNAERIRKCKDKMQGAGFKRLNIWAHPELLALLRLQRRGNECYGRTLERLCLGEAKKRPSATAGVNTCRQMRREI